MRSLLTHTRRLGRSLLLFLPIAFTFARTASADPPVVESDVVLAAKVSAAIAANPDLAGLNLTVDVVNRAAEIGGPVPDAAAVPKIEAAARTVPGVLSVRVTGWVTGAEDPLTAAVRKELAGPPAPATAKPALPTLVLVPRPDPATTTPPSALPRPAAAEPADGSVTAQRIPAAVANGFLLAPVGPNGVDPSAAPAPYGAIVYPTIPPQGVPVGTLTSGGTAVAIDAARTADPRFARLGVELRGGTAVISGLSVRLADAWDFAAAVRKVPGVERVVVGSVSR